MPGTNASPHDWRRPHCDRPQSWFDPPLPPPPFPAPALLPHVVGVIITPPTGKKRLILSVYLPHDTTAYHQCLDFVASLPTLFPDTDILIAGDLQAPWATTSAKGEKLFSSLSPSFTRLPFTDPTFVPAHAPLISTCIDHMLTLPTDPWARMLGAICRTIPTSFTDHCALLLTVPASYIDIPPPPTPPTTKARPKLLRPIPKPALDAWAQAEALILDPTLVPTHAQLTALLGELSISPAHARPMSSLISTLNVLAGILTMALTEAYSRALHVLPKIAAPQPVHPRTQQAFWPRHIKQPIAIANARAKLLRSFIRAPPQPYHALTHLLQALHDHPLPDDAPATLTPPPDSPPSAELIPSLHKAHKRYVRSLIR